MSNLVLPRVQAMVLCDGLKESDEEPEVFNLIGVRTAIDAASFPAFHPRLVAFIQMSGHAGTVSCQLGIERIETNDMIYESPVKSVSLVSPTNVSPVYFRVRNCVFARPGVYYVQLFADGKLIGERPLKVRELE